MAKRARKPNRQETPPKLRNAPLRIPLPFERLVDAMLDTKPVEKVGKPKKKPKEG